MTKLFDVKANGEIIYWTKDYELFTILSGNRIQNVNHVKRLKSLILKNGWRKSSLLIVNKDLKIMDGQHRLWALKDLAKETGNVFEIGYVFDNSMTMKTIQTLNSAVLAWRPMDYIRSHIRLGNKNYQFIQNMIDEFPFTVTAVLSLISKFTGEITKEKFRNGEIIIKDADKPKIWNNAVCIKRLSVYYKSYNTATFITAMAFFLDKPGFDFDKFLNKLETHRDLLYPVTTVSAYKERIQYLYNYHNHNRITFIQA